MTDITQADFDRHKELRGRVTPSCRAVDKAQAKVAKSRERYFSTFDREDHNAYLMARAVLADAKGAFSKLCEELRLIEDKLEIE